MPAEGVTCRGDTKAWYSEVREALEPGADSDSHCPRIRIGQKGTKT